MGFQPNDFVIDGHVPSPSSSSFAPPALPRCPGYCGWWPPAQAQSNNTSYGAITEIDDNINLIFAYCRPCPWGMRKDGALQSSQCRPCESPLHAHDYMFLLFHALVPFLLNSAAIGYHSAARLRPNQRRLLWMLLQTAFALLEGSIAFLGALCIFPPIGQLRTFGCARDGTLNEWYSMWNNPVLDYTRVLHCSSELVYPLYSLPFAIFALNLATILLLRPFLYAAAALCNGRRNLLPTAPFYAALWSLPLLALGHSFLSGVLYALFPFIALLAALLQLVIHLSAYASPQAQPSGARSSGGSVRAMLRRVLLAHRCCCIPQLSAPSAFSIPFSLGLSSPLWLPLLIHFALFAYALLALFIAFGAPSTGELNELLQRVGLWTLVPTIVGLLPLPTLFFVLTVRLTAPWGRALAHR